VTIDEELEVLDSHLRRLKIEYEIHSSNFDYFLVTGGTSDPHEYCLTSMFE
jgi:hypothetical protein